MIKKARIIYNPSSGKGVMKKKLPYVLQRLEQAGYETSAFMTKGKNSARIEAKTCALRKYDLIVACGGDGTISEVASGISESTYHPVLGVIPSGTTNDLARALGIPKDIKLACDILCDNHFKPIDVGKIGNQYFINVTATGNLVEVTYQVPRKIKKVIGHLSYYISGVFKLPFIKSKFVEIDYDDNHYEGKVFLVVICNTTSVGGNKLAPYSKYDDGLFDLIIFEKMSMFQLIRLGPQILNGKYKHTRVKYLKAKAVKISSIQDLKVNIDGEYGGRLPIELSNLQHHLNILLPKYK